MQGGYLEYKSIGSGDGCALEIEIEIGLGLGEGKRDGERFRTE